MLIALLGISIPSFWQGLIFILTFSINFGWLPATYSSTNAMSLIMPTVVLGERIMVSVARMTRSSTLEVINLKITFLRQGRKDFLKRKLSCVMQYPMH